MSPYQQQSYESQSQSVWTTRNQLASPIVNGIICLEMVTLLY